MSENNDWGNYFAKAEICLRNNIESSDRLRRSDKRYSLYSKIIIIEGDFDKNTGAVSDYADCSISADRVEALEEIWKKSFLIRKYSTTHPHFIFDNAEGKVIKILSMCA